MNDSMKDDVRYFFFSALPNIKFHGYYFFFIYFCFIISIIKYDIRNNKDEN